MEVYELPIIQDEPRRSRHLRHLWVSFLLNDSAFLACLDLFALNVPTCFDSKNFILFAKHFALCSQVARRSRHLKRGDGSIILMCLREFVT